MKLEELLKALSSYGDQFAVVQDYLNGADKNVLKQKITSVVNDHTKVGQGSIFVAIEGTKIDSHNFIAEAKAKGAIFTIGSKPTGDPFNEPDLIVENTRAVLGRVASLLLGDPSALLSIYGVTGTNGKTTTTYILKSMFEAMKKKYCVIGTTGIFIDDQKLEASQTTPDSLVLQKLFAKLRKDKIENVAMEVSSHSLDQMRVYGTDFLAVGFTNLTQDHLDYHENFENYFEAKAKLFDGYYANTAVINIDDAHGPKLFDFAKKNEMKVVSTSIKDKNANVYVELLSSSLSGCEIEVTICERTGEVDYQEKIQTSLVGDFNCENIATAIGLAYFGDIDFEYITKALNSNIQIPGRLQRVESTGVTFEVFVDYSHTPDALKRAIEVLKPLAKRVIVVFGCGGDRDKAKRPMMGKISSELADITVVTSDNPRSESPTSIIDEIMAGVNNTNLSKVNAITDRAKAIEYALSIATEGDAVLIAGKGHETYQEFATRTENFSDLDVATEILKGNN